MDEGDGTPVEPARLFRLEAGSRVTGRIKKIVRDKGFGFIEPDDGSDDVFFHRSRLDQRTQFEDLREGDEVQFLVRSGEKGPQALGLKLR